MITQRLTQEKKRSLYGLTGDFADALADVTIDEDTGEIVGMDRVRELGAQTEEKLVACANFVRDTEALIDGMKAAKSSLDARIKSKQNLVNNLKAIMLDAMIKLNAKKIEEGGVYVSIRKNAASVEIYDDSLLPDDVWVEKVERSISKTAVKERLKAGEDIQGARLVQTTSIRIK